MLQRPKLPEASDKEKKTIGEKDLGGVACFIFLEISRAPKSSPAAITPWPSAIGRQGSGLPLFGGTMGIYQATNPLEGYPAGRFADAREGQPAGQAARMTCRPAGEMTPQPMPPPARA